MARGAFYAFVLLSLLGDARMFLFVMNRFVYGSHRQEKSPWNWLFWVVPPVLLVLTLFAAKEWLIIAAAVGAYWILDRIRVLTFGTPPLVGIRTLPSEVIALRRAHVPFAWVRRLGAHNDVYDIEVTHHEVIIDDLPEAFDGYRVAFLTDLHIAGFMRRRFFDEVVAQALRLDPDIVILGGDLVSFARDIPLMAEVLGQLRAKDGVFAVLGNHDIWADAAEIERRLTERGVQYLTNRSVMLTRGTQTLPLAGVDEVYRGTPDVERALSGIQGPCIAVSHHPDIIDDLDGRRIDLLLCGHTHGGQIRFPFFGAVVVPSHHEAEFAAGFHRVRNVLMYVSRGIGSIPPLRILCRPEVASFVLRRGHRTS